MLIGAHTSIAGGLHNAAAEATSIGAEVMQIFCKNQRQWIAKPLTDEEIIAYKRAVSDAKLGPVMVHDSYLINMGTPDPAKAANASNAFSEELRRCSAMGVEYLNFHSGSHTHPAKPMRDDKGVRQEALDRIAVAVTSAMDAVEEKSVKLTIENAAGQGTNVGTTFEEISYLMDKIGDARVGVCLDTQHAWACGYNWVENYDEIFDNLNDQIGFKNLWAFHLNDSKSELGSRVDRHDPIGQGSLGAEFFERLMQDKRFDHASGYLETPDGPEVWKKEIEMLKAWRN